MLNTILIIAIIVLMVAGLVWYVNHTDVTEQHEKYDNFLTIPSLSKLVRESFSTSLKKGINEQNLTEEEYYQISSSKEELKTSIRVAPLGDKQAKAFVLSYMKDILQNQHLGRISAMNIYKVIHFNEPELMKSRDRFEFLTFLWMKEGRNGFSKNFIKYGLHLPTKTPYGNVYVVTEEKIMDVYNEYMAENYASITYVDKINFVNQRVYEDTYGLGPVDMLLETDIDEIQAGVSGIPADSYEVEVEDTEKISYSFESVWIVFKGLNIHLKATTFGTQKELVRVCRNIYRYNSPKILTKRDPGIIASMKNGNRIMVACPEFSDSYCFIARKFDSTESLAPEYLLGERKNEQSSA